MNRRDMISNMKRSQTDPFDKIERNFWRMFVLVLIGNLIFFGVVIWAVVELVQWITSK